MVKKFISFFVDIYGNTYDEFENFTVEIQEDGTYEIVCRGRNAKGNIEFEIQ